MVSGPRVSNSRKNGFMPRRIEIGSRGCLMLNMITRAGTKTAYSTSATSSLGRVLPEDPVVLYAR